MIPRPACRMFRQDRAKKFSRGIRAAIVSFYSFWHAQIRDRSRYRDRPAPPRHAAPPRTPSNAVTPATVSAAGNTGSGRYGKSLR